MGWSSGDDGDGFRGWARKCGGAAYCTVDDFGNLNGWCYHYVYVYLYTGIYVYREGD